MLCAVLSGSGLFGLIGYAIGVVVVAAIVLPKVRRAGQPMKPWITATLLVPLVTYALVRFRAR